MKERLFRLAVRLRRRMPAWFDRWLSSLLASEGWFAGKIKAALAANESIPDAVIASPQAEVRLLIAPFNYASQGYLWAQALNNSGASVSAVNYAVTGAGLTFPATVHIPASVFVGSMEWKNRLREAMPQFTHVIIESFGSLYGQGTGTVVLKEIEALQSMGISVALLCHGSDIRSPEAFVSRNPRVRLSDFGEGVDRLRRAAAQGAEVLRSFSGHVFVSTPDLLHDVPGATLLPVVIDPRPWKLAAATPRARRAVPLVIHVPSNTGIKGSVHVRAAAQRLHDEGVIEYCQLEGIAHERMPEVIGEADIVVDQMLLGSYGVAACEAMAAGKAVVSNVFADVREAAAREAGVELPIVQADSNSLETVLRELALAPERREQIGRAAEQFVRVMHTGERTLPALKEYLGLDSE